jgi:uncharacterized protein YggE
VQVRHKRRAGEITVFARGDQRHAPDTAASQIAVVITELRRDGQYPAPRGL